MFPCSHVLHRHGAGLPDWVSDNSFRWRLRARSWNTDFLPSCPIIGPPPYFIRPLQYRGRISSVFDLGGSCLRWIQSFCGLEEWGPSMDLKRWVPLWTWRVGSFFFLLILESSKVLSGRFHSSFRWFVRFSLRLFIRWGEFRGLWASPRNTDCVLSPRMKQIDLLHQGSESIIQTLDCPGCWILE